MIKRKLPKQVPPTLVVPVLPTTEELVADAEACARSFYYFLTTHVKSLNATNNTVALIPKYPYIKEMADNLQYHKGSIVYIKSRQMLFSIVIMAYALWRILYTPNWTIQLLSKKGESVSDGTFNSLIGKIQFYYDRLPQHLKQTLVFTSRPMRVQNTNNNSILSGETSNENASRGNTNSEAILDEWAYVENDELIFRSVVMASERVIGFSTPCGETGTFHRIFTEAKDNGFLRLKVHWSQHPNRDAAWYAKKTAAMTPDDIARELECSFKGSYRGNIFTVKPTTLIDTINYKNIKLSDYLLRCGMDFGLGDQTCIVTALQHKDTMQLTIVATLADNEMLPEAFNTQYLEQLRLLGLIDLLPSAQIYADPSGWNRSLNNARSVAAEYEDLHLPITKAPRCEILDRIREVQRWLGGTQLSITQEAHVAYDTLAACHYPVKNDIITAKDRWADPSKNFNVHMMDSIAYLLHSLALPVGDGIGEAIKEQVYQEIKGAGGRRR